MGKKNVLLFAALGLICAFGFQNCTGQGFESSNTLTGTTSSSSTDAKATGAPFPYEMNANVFSYMSCPTASQSPNADAYYSFKLKAVETTSFNTIVSSLLTYQQRGQIPSTVKILPQMAEGGIHLSPDYLTYMDKNFKGLKPQATTEQIQGSLQNHPDYKNARLQFSIRKRSDVRNSLLNYPGNQTAVVAQWILEKLSAPLINKVIADNRDKLVNTFPKSSLEPATIGTSLAYSSASEIDMNNYRSLIEREYYLTMAFIKNDGEAGSSIQLGAFPAGTDGIQGVGYALQFTNPTKPLAVPNSAYNTNSVDPVSGSQIPKPRSTVASGTGVFEYNLATGQASSGIWNCFNYGIVRYEDRALCPVEQYNQISRDKLEVVRKILKPEDWQVNTTLGCITPTASNSAFSCYTTTTANPAAEKTVWNTLLSQATPLGFGYPYSDPVGTPLTTGIEYRYWSKNCSGSYRECVNFATFCFKQK